MLFKIILEDVPLDEQEKIDNPDTAFKVKADIDVDGDLEALSKSILGLMEKQDGIADILLNAVTDFMKKYPNYLDKN